MADHERKLKQAIKLTTTPMYLKTVQRSVSSLRICNAMHSNFSHDEVASTRDSI